VSARNLADIAEIPDLHVADGILVGNATWLAAHELGRERP